MHGMVIHRRNSTAKVQKLFHNAAAKTEIISNFISFGYDNRKTTHGAPDELLLELGEGYGR